MEKETMGCCCLCGEHKVLIGAHILPRAFYADLKSEDSQDMTLMGDKCKRLVKNGIKDNGILCAECDNLLGDLDNEAIKFFRTDFSKYKNTVKDPKSDKVLYLYVVPPDVFKIKKLILFFVALLYRASISTSYVFKNVSLGKKYENLFRESLLRGEIPKEVQVSMGLFEDTDNSGGKLSFFPGMEKIGGVNYYNFYYNLFQIKIKVDQRDGIFNPIAFIEDEEIKISDLGDFAKSETRTGFVTRIKELDKKHSRRKDEQ